MRKALVWFVFAVVSFAFVSCSNKGGSVNAHSRVPAVSQKSVAPPGVSHKPTAPGSHEFTAPDGDASIKFEFLTLAPGDTITLISAKLQDEDSKCEFVFEKRRKGEVQRKSVTVAIQPTEGHCRPLDVESGGDGAYLGTLEGLPLWVYAFKGDASTSGWAPAGKNYFRVSVGDNVNGRGDFMMFPFDGENGFVSGTVAADGDFGGNYHIDNPVYETND
ncbi:MAG: hypothetical protein LBD17_02550 [Endomicrobium sp.]|jgi:hypothetical protein|nr:hypothetical protein [Endomicrobium sp.]